MKGSIALVLIILLSSCAKLKHANFNRQKFTDLKTRAVKDDDCTTKNKSFETASTPVDQRAIEEEPNESALKTKDESTNETSLQNEINTPTQDLENRQTDIQDFKNSEIEVEEPEDENEQAFNSIETALDSQDKDLENFHLLFQIGLMIFLISVLLYAMVIFAGLNYIMLYFCLASASATILATWIISLVLIKRGKKIKQEERTVRFKTEFTLAWIVGIIGSIIATAFLIGIGALIVFAL